MEQAEQAMEAPSVPGADRLCDLPTEMIASICEHLDGADISNFRLASRTIHAKSYRAFFDCQFEVTAVTFTKKGLEKFVEFSKDPNIGRSIKGVELVLVAFPTLGKQHLTGVPYTSAEFEECQQSPGMLANLHTSTNSGDITSKAFIKPRQQEAQRRIYRRRRRVYSNYQHDMNTIRKTSVDVALLAEAFRHLPGLNNIWMTDYIPEGYAVWGLPEIIGSLGMRPFYASMLSWVPQKQDSYESQFQVERELKAIATHSVGVVLGAIRRSGVTFSGGLNFYGVPHGMKFAEKPCHRKLSPSITPPSTFNLGQIAEMNYLSHVKELSIRFFCQANRRYSTDPVDAREFEWLSQVLLSMADLETFSLFGEESANELTDVGILGNLSHLLIKLPRLTVLSLENMLINTPTLIAFLENHKATLQRIYLDNINLRTIQPINGTGDRAHLLLLPWLECNDFSVAGYTSAAPSLPGHQFGESQEGFREVCVTQNGALSAKWSLILPAVGEWRFGGTN
ncbi:hypothetical protein P171DRAFT_483870 [Karstenula rhodostoma CBS 690.94]|uniref:F-box domain-containing protein n=1 Tax=Karstenula rhodostoma CBS 690.94 TaxID=1392251 RepID=A0A9P4PNK0_9PLEO|nr:hypothetical protein P171DRAFT_483870 [Karstenula rhodostoma CBS 690.94]